MSLLHGERVRGMGVPDCKLLLSSTRLLLEYLPFTSLSQVLMFLNTRARVLQRHVEMVPIMKPQRYNSASVGSRLQRTQYSRFGKEECQPGECLESNWSGCHSVAAHLLGMRRVQVPSLAIPVKDQVGEYIREPHLRPWGAAATLGRWD